MKRLHTGTILLLLAVAMVGPAGSDTAVIVNKENTVSDISVSQLKRIYLGDTRRWAAVGGADQAIELTDYKGDPKRVADFYRVATGTSPIRLRTQWLGMVFRGDIPELPASLKSETEMIRHVHDHPNAIGFVESSFIDSLPTGVKVIKVNAKLPGQEGYVLP